MECEDELLDMMEEKRWCCEVVVDGSNAAVD
jgi:hypothetical protein